MPSSSASLLALLTHLTGPQTQENIEVQEDATLKTLKVPKGWNAYKIRAWAEQKIEEEETIVRCHHPLQGIPADVLFGMWTVLDRDYGFTKALADKTWFGDVPPVMVNIKTSPTTSVSVPFSKISPPAWEGGYIRPIFDNTAGRIIMTGEFKRKFQKEVDNVLMSIEQQLRTTSLYKGKSIQLNFDWKKTGEYNFDLHSPVFVTPPNLSYADVILNKPIETAFQSSIFSRLCNREMCIKNGIAFKQGVILGGPYGTGKSLSGALISKVATDNGVTFIHLKDAKYAAEAMLIAKHYGPSVLFCEDIDQVVQGEARTEDLNNILNTLDGIDTKNMEVICIFTTNHPERINSAFLRPGRIDKLILMELPDSKSAQRFLEKHGRAADGTSLLSSDIDLEACGAVLANKPPAFIASIIDEAKTLAIYHNPDATSLEGTMTTDVIVNCTKMKEGQIAAASMKNVDPVETLANACRIAGQLFTGDGSMREFLIGKATDSNVA